MYNRCAASPIPESSQSDFSLRRLLQTAIVHTHSTVLYQLCPIHTVENRGEKIEEAKLRADGPIYERCCPPAGLMVLSMNAATPPAPSCCMTLPWWWAASGCWARRCGSWGPGDPWSSTSRTSAVWASGNRSSPFSFSGRINRLFVLFLMMVCSAACLLIHHPPRFYPGVISILLDTLFCPYYHVIIDFQG